MNEIAIRRGRKKAAASGAQTRVQAKNRGGLRKPSGSRLWFRRESGTIRAALDVGGSVATPPGTVNAQQAVQGAPEQQPPPP